MAAKLTTLTRRCHFSSGHAYRVEGLSEEENRKLFGKLFVPAGLGHNFVLEVTVAGELAEETGMICDLGDIDLAMKQVSDPFDHHFINHDIPEFAETVPTPETLSVHFFKALRPLLLEKGTHIKRVRVYEGEDVWGDHTASLNEDEALITRKISISCLHRHHNPDLSPEENEKLYYKCSRMHGHEYKLEVTLKGKIDPQSGMVFPRPELEEILEEKIVKVFHGSYLNEHVGNTSGEIILQFFENQLKNEFAQDAFYGLRLRETRKNHFTTPRLVQRIGESL